MQYQRHDWSHILDYKTDLFDIRLPQFIGTSMVGPSPEGREKLNFNEREMVDQGRGRPDGDQQVRQEANTTLGDPHTDDETDNCVTSIGELCKPPGPPTGAPHMLETGTRGPYDPHGLRAPSLKLLQNPVNDTWREEKSRFRGWKDEMIYLLLFVGLYGIAQFTQRIVTIHVVYKGWSLCHDTHQFHCPLRGTSKSSFQHYNGRLVVHIAQLDFGCGFCWRICLSVMTVSLNEIL